MRTIALTAVFAACLLVAACGKDGNPILPTDPSPTDPGKLSLTVTCNCTQVETGASSAVTLKIVARRADGTAPADGTQVTVNTSLGNFGLDSTGKPVQLVTRTLVSGSADVQFFAGPTAGVANILAQSGTAIGSLNLSLVDPPPPPVAEFTFSQSGLSVLFTDASTNASSYRWRFGDGRESTERNPMHTYQVAGTYTVTLTVTNSGGSADKSKFIDVTLGQPPEAAFAFTVNGLQVNFVDRSKNDPTSWSWIFGDGGTSNLRNPIHTYAAAGQYTVVLIASNAAGSNSTSDVVKIDPGARPVAKFQATVTGKQVNFVDQSTGDPTSWSWAFGDGGTSTLRNPVHVYAAAGTYTVTLTVTNAAGSNSASDAVKIEPGAPPVADFQFTVSGHQVNFVDRSTGSPASWSWAFGDGGTSTQQNPVHVYPSAGSYTVSLTVTNADGSGSKSQVVTIEAAPAPKAAFTFTKNGLQVAFADASTGSPTTWLWDFGDSSGLSTQQNPIHTYAAAGNYTVTLSVSNASGTNSVSQIVAVTSSP